MDLNDLFTALSFVLWEQQIGDRHGTAAASRWAQFILALMQLEAAR